MKTVEEIIADIDQSIERRLERPAMYGSDEAVEMEFLTLMQLRCFITEEDKGDGRYVLDRFIAHNDEYFPMRSNITLSALVKEFGLRQYFTKIIREFYKDMLSGRDFEKHRTFMEIHKTGAAPPPFEVHADAWKSNDSFHKAMGYAPVKPLWEYLGFSENEKKVFVDTYRLPKRPHDEMWYENDE